MFRTELCKIDIRDSDLVNVKDAVNQIGKLKWKTTVEIPVKFDFIEKGVPHCKDLESWEKYIKIGANSYIDICYDFFEGEQGILEGENMLELPSLWVSEAALEKINAIGFDNINLNNSEARKLKKYIMLKRMDNE
jgi:hypothetical protein